MAEGNAENPERPGNTAVLTPEEANRERESIALEQAVAARAAGQRLPGLEGRGLPEDITSLPTEGDRRKWLDEKLEIIEREAGFPFDDGTRGVLERVIQENLRIAPMEGAERLKKMEEYLQEIRARWWLHNLHQNMMAGEFGEAVKYLRFTNQFLPTVYDLPGVGQALKEYEENDYEIFRQNGLLQEQFAKNLGSRENAGPVGQRLAERLLHALGVSATASLVFKEDAKPFQALRGLPREQQIEKLKQLPWQEQLECLDLKNSLAATTIPADLKKILFYGYTLEKSAAEDKPEGLPKVMPKMRQNMLFPVKNYLETAKRDEDKEAKKKGIPARWEKDKEVPTVEVLVDRIRAIREQRETSFSGMVAPQAGRSLPPDFDKLPWREQEKYIDFSETVSRIEGAQGTNPTGAGFLWALGLVGYKGLTESLEKGFLGKPSAAGLPEALGPVNKLKREDKEQIVKIVAQNTYEYLTESKAAYFKGPNTGKEAAASLFEMLADLGLLSRAGEESLKKKNLGHKFWRSLKAGWGMLDLAGAYLAFIKTFFQEIIGKIGK